MPRAGRSLPPTCPACASAYNPDEPVFWSPENPQRLADAIVHMTSQRQQADAWGGEARRFARQFDWHDIALRHLELFRELAAQARMRAA